MDSSPIETFNVGQIYAAGIMSATVWTPPPMLDYKYSLEREKYRRYGFVHEKEN